MKLILHAIRTNPNSIQEIQMEDVANFFVDDTSMIVTFNTEDKQEVIPFRANDGTKIHEWAGFSIFGTRVGMKVDMTK